MILIVKGVAVPGTSRIPRSRVLFVLVFGLYSAGLLIWLILGILPSAHVVHVNAMEMSMAMSIPMSPSVATLITAYAFSLVNFAMGLLLIVRKPDEPVARLLGLALLGTAATFNMPSHVAFQLLGHPPLITGLHFTFHIVSGVAYVWAVAFFPDNRLPRSLTMSTTAKRIVAVAATVVIATISAKGAFLDHPIFFTIFFGALIPAVGIPLQSLRIRETDDPLLVQQSRLFRTALVPALCLAVVWIGAWFSGHFGIATKATAMSVQTRVEDLFPAVFVLVPVMLFIAILRYRLWRIDILLGRAFLYGATAIALSLLYVVLVPVVASIVGTGLMSTIVAAAICGTAAQGLIARLKRIVNRLVFGELVSPAEAMQALTDSLERSAATNELVELTRVTVEATRALQAELWVWVDRDLISTAAWPVGSNRDTAPTATLSGRSLVVQQHDSTAVVLPISHQGAPLGILSVQLPNGVHLPRSEMKLLSDLAGHAGLLVHNAQLTAELARHVEKLSRQTEELKMLRQRVVTAQQDERRRLERNLHDGTQQELVAYLLGLQTLDTEVNESAKVDAREQLATMLDSLEATLRDVCAGQVPEVLRDEGLSQSLMMLADITRRAGIAVKVECNTHRLLPLDVATAVYFCCAEALQNAAKHAHPSEVVVSVVQHDQELRFFIRDDGTGFDPSAVAKQSGLANMAARMAVVGGHIGIESEHDGGTKVFGIVPISSETFATLEDVK